MLHLQPATYIHDGAQHTVRTVDRRYHRTEPLSPTPEDALLHYCVHKSCRSENVTPTSGYSATFVRFFWQQAEPSPTYSDYCTGVPPKSSVICSPHSGTDTGSIRFHCAEEPPIKAVTNINIR